VQQFLFQPDPTDGVKFKSIKIAFIKVLLK